MRFHWGHGILIALIAIVVTFSTALILSFRQDHQLVTENYYSKELAFQGQIDKKNNATREGKTIEWEMNNQELVVTVLPKPVTIDSGKVQLVRMSDMAYDREGELNDDGSWHLASSELKRGKYNLLVEWTEAGVTYFAEKSVFVQ